MEQQFKLIKAILYNGYMTQQMGNPITGYTPCMVDFFEQKMSFEIPSFEMNQKQAVLNHAGKITQTKIKPALQYRRMMHCDRKD